MLKIPVKLKYKVDDSYGISVGDGIFDTVIHNEIRALSPTKTVLISDSNVFKIYENKIREMLGDSLIIETFRAGEASKTINTIMELFASLAKNKFDRKSLIIAFGGGVTGDMAGFLASVYMRGIRFIQIPTSLLAIADSSIGGKTGVDADEGKNLIGCFHQPNSVIIDTKFLQTLPRPEFINGMAEIIKHAVIRDRKYFDFLKTSREMIEKLDIECLTAMIEKSCRIKGKVVEADQKEKGLRQILNFGHTIGHAVEKISGFEIPHGYAVAYGMLMEARIAEMRNMLPASDLDSITGLISDYGLLAYGERIKQISQDQLIEAVQLDKKNIDKNIKAVMIKEIGKVIVKEGKYSFTINDDEIIKAFKWVLNI